MSQETKLRRAAIIFAVLAAVIGLFRLISITHVIGDMGNGYYAAAYEIYSIMIIVAAVCISNAVSRMVHSRVVRGQIRNAYKVMQSSFVVCILLGGIFTLFTLFGADSFTGGFMHLEESADTLKLLAPAILAACIAGALKGFMNGFEICVPVSLISILEQLLMWGISFLCSRHYYQYGIKIGNLVQNDTYRYVYGAYGAVMGITIGAVISLVLLIVLYFMKRPMYQKLLRKDGTVRDENYGQIYHVLLKTALPLMALLILLNLHTLLAQRYFQMHFEELGQADYAVRTFGVYYVKFRTIIMLPLVALCETSSYIRYEIKAVLANKNAGKIREFVRRKIRNILLYAIPCMVFVAVLAAEIGGLLFGGNSEMLNYMLLPGSLMIVLYSVAAVLGYVLFFMDYKRVLFVILVIANAFYLLSLDLMMRVGNLGIEALMGAAILFAVVIVVGEFVAVSRLVKYRQELLYSIFIPYISAFATGVILFLIHFLLGGRIGSLLTILLSLLIGIPCYWIGIVLLHGIRDGEFDEIPGGAIIAVALEKLHII